MTSILQSSVAGNYEKSAAKSADNSTPEYALLGKNASIVAKQVRTTNSATTAFRLMAAAQHILIEHNVLGTKGGKHRTRMCHAVRHKNAEHITLKLSIDEKHSKASLSGVQTCGSFWSCPVCAGRLAVKRGGEVAQALAWAEKEKHIPLMVSMTARHDASMTLKDFKARFKQAWRKFTQNGSWRRLKAKLEIKNSIKVIENTRGEHGWHYHQHGLLFAPKSAVAKLDENDLDNWQAEMRRLWMHCLAAAGLDGIPDIALRVSFHGNVGADYLSKLGLKQDDQTNARWEVSGAQNKKGGRTVWNLLKSASQG
ncbi:hypothetical protein LCGC14_2929160, partial [marine sediment metagenome]